MVFFENYFQPNQQMPTTSGFRDDFFFNTLQHTSTKHKQFHLLQLLTILFLFNNTLQHTATHGGSKL